jgi:3-hydroxyacyl-CoA dehydrogenase / enoyl-CoA hydratase / 3-hydroxybutyryl-CoA epimerase
MTQPSPEPQRSRGSSAFFVERRADGVAIVRIDVPGESMNTLRQGFAEELEAALAEIEKSEVKAVVLASGKPEGFIAGADIKMLQKMRTANEAAELAKNGRRALERIANFPKPVVAAIHGACLGGGLEVALACHARVATSDDKTRLGLPEVQLGLLPGLGGTQRLPRLVGAEAALDLMLTGKQLDAKRAQRIGLVDEVVPPSILVEVACKRALELASGKKSVGRDRSGRQKFVEALLVKNPLGRSFFFDQAKKRTLKKTHGNYPAAERILEVVRIGLSRGMEAGFGAESAAFGELAVSAEARELIGIFFAQNELKKDTGTSDASAEPRKLRRVGVLGAGLMGAGIAYVTAVNAKLPVRLKDRDDKSLGRGVGHMRTLFDDRAKKRKMSAFERDRELLRVTTTTSYDGFDAVDVVIEAVFEDLKLKQDVLREVESHGGKNLIFASNTSSLPITKIAEASRAPERVVGMHYFSPVDKMPLLEVVVTEKTAASVTATAVELGKKQGKTVIVVRDGAGFYTSRVLGPYLNEASYLVSEGVPIDVIDRALETWGFPVGPLTLLDEVGIDVGEKVGKILHNAFGERMAPPPGVERLVEDQRLGKKNGRGFYDYGTKKRGRLLGRSSSKRRPVDASVYQVLGVEPKADPPGGEIAQRCALMMVNEAVYCLAEGILRSARDGDIGAVFGLGFPPFRGGPFRYVDVVGPSEIVRRLEGYEKTCGARFRPAPLLVEMARAGRTFYT